MAIRIKHTVNIFISEDTEGLHPLFGKQDCALETTTVDAFDRCVSGKLNIAASGTENLPFGDVDSPIRGFSIEADRGFNIVFSGGSDILQVRPAVAPTSGGAGTGAKIFVECDNVTQVAITNPDATNAINGTYVVWGEPTP